MERDAERDWAPDEMLPWREELPPAVASGIEIDGQGRAVIAGTTIEAHRIAALLDGEMDVDEVLGDYISLTRAQVLSAKAYADAHPWTGEPFPPLTAKKAMREAKLEGFEEYLPRRR
jgi:uncharacterized protein (DUF433 family)